MTTTVNRVADGAEVRVSRLTAHILLASIARDAGVDMPDSVKFTVGHGRVELIFDQVDEMAEWVRVLDAGAVTVAVSDLYIHHDAGRTDWNGWRLYLRCLVARPAHASVEADVTAVLDSLITSAPWISVASGEPVDSRFKYTCNGCTDGVPHDGHVYECCGKAGRISRHESWCHVMRDSAVSA